ncbi:MAG TPA: phospho-sugar mutase [Anaerovoracaceae bacterium]|nr:phospho-sugar mutase [Anaerovoracaceae bacterium]
MNNAIRLGDALEKMEQWLSYSGMPPKLHRELKNLEDRLVRDSGDKEAKEEIYERFYKDLDFGTGGLRGIIGAGNNRMNQLTVRRVTQGFADYINRNYIGNDNPSIAIAYDSRNDSVNFALQAAGVLAANGIVVYIYRELMPTPALSFAVRHYRCEGGIMITASHNPSNYNGYKVYNQEGCQVTDEAAGEILECINKVDMFTGVRVINIGFTEINDLGLFNGNHFDNINVIPPEVIDAYIEAVKNTRVGVDCKDLEIVFTPLNGTGNKPVRRILSEIGVEKIHIVAEQEKPDGNFPTCPYPNPEKEEALFRGLELCKQLGTPDILLATDPDCDRLGVAVRHRDDKTGEIIFQRLSGNEIGVLLLDFLCSKNELPKGALALKTIVSTKMADTVASSYGVEVKSLLTGFKYIGEQIGFLEAKGQEERFIFGFEESYGYLAGSYVRDKDAVNAAMLISEAAADYKGQGKTLIDRMEELYNTHGWYLNSLMDFGFQGASGMLKMKEILTKLRSTPPTEIIGLAVVSQTDYETGKRYIISQSCDMAAGYRPTGLPFLNVLEYDLANGSSIIVRPSGTEPKLKIYLSAKGNDKVESTEIIEKLQEEVREWVL